MLNGSLSEDILVIQIVLAYIFGRIEITGSMEVSNQVSVVK